MPKLTEGLLTTLTVANGRKDRLVFDTVAPGLGVRPSLSITLQVI